LVLFDQAFFVPANILAYFSFVKIKSMNKLLILILLLAVALAACEDDGFYTGADAELKFSADTVMFDTVFTSMGSLTRRLKVYNPYDSDIQISEIALAKAGASSYRLNVDGEQGNAHENVLLRGKDSLFIFIELNIAENGEQESFEEVDSIIFRLNTSQQDVDLRAWGLNVIRLNDDISEDMVFTDLMPYLVTSPIRVKENVRCEIQKGTCFYFGRKGGLRIDGEFIVKGAVDDPVVFRTSRLDKEYFDVPGLWHGISCSANSKVELKWAEILNATTGLYLDSVQAESHVLIENSKISHHAYASLVVKNTNVQVYNSELANAGSYLLNIENGGAHEFIHCTLANYWPSRYNARFTQSVTMNNFSTDKNTSNRDLNIKFSNSIVFGDRFEEISFSNEMDGIVQNANSSIRFENCVLRTDKDRRGFEFVNSVFDYPEFLNTEMQDFQLDTLSPAKDVALKMGYFPFDLKGNDRYADGKPDIGAYERIELE